MAATVHPDIKGTKKPLLSLLPNEKVKLLSASSVSSGILDSSKAPPCSKSSYVVSIDSIKI